MNNLKLVIILLIFILSSCTQTIQKNGLSENKIENFDIKIGETSKNYLINKYGPPIFQNVFNNNVIYYVSHITSYKTFDKRKTEKLSVLEITLDNKNIVQKINIALLIRLKLLKFKKGSKFIKLFSNILISTFTIINITIPFNNSPTSQ